MWELYHGDCVNILKTLDPESFDSIVTDPPYALSFMGKDWDSFGDGKGFQAWCEDWAKECLRVLKPGGHMLAFGGTRTYHREACAVEDAGFEIRDSLHWIYGSGFPKSRDIGKAIDKEAGAEREITGTRKGDVGIQGGNFANKSEQGVIVQHDKPTTDAAKQWNGWGTALKPAHEPVIMARKPLAPKHTVAANVLEYSTGGINVDGCRIGTEPITAHGGGVNAEGRKYGGGKGIPAIEAGSNPHEGRWPPNIILTHSPLCTEPSELTEEIREAFELNENGCRPDCPVAEMDRQSGKSTSTIGKPRKSAKPGEGYGMTHTGTEHEDSGGASRFFPCFRYQAKASAKERPVVPGLPGHPTVKPVALMQWLVRLVTPPNGTVLDPFAGTGTTAEACEKEGFSCTLIENDGDSVQRIIVRMQNYPGEIVDELTFEEINDEWEEETVRE